MTVADDEEKVNVAKIMGNEKVFAETNDTVEAETEIAANEVDHAAEAGPAVVQVDHDMADTVTTVRVIETVPKIDTVEVEVDHVEDVVVAEPSAREESDTALVSVTDEANLQSED